MYIYIYIYILRESEIISELDNYGHFGTHRYEQTEKERKKVQCRKDIFLQQML